MNRASDDPAAPPNPFEDGVPFGTKLRELAEQRRDDPAVTVVALDGTAQALTFGELDACANQWGRALAAGGAETGSYVALAIPNSQHLVLATLGCWKIGAVPIPMHWDLPEWERDRVRAVIDPAVVVDETSRWELAARAAGESESPLPTAVSPTANGICSSGSTGVPKVILNLAPSLWIPQQGEPFMANWTPVAQPQTIMVPAPMYHTNGFATFLMLLAGDHLVILEKFNAALVLDVIERYRVTNFTATPTMLARIAARPDVRQRDLSSVVFILQGAAVMPPALLHTWFELLSPEQILTAYGMTENLGLTALRGDEWLTHPGSVGRGFRDTEIRILDADKNPLGPGEDGDIYLRAPMSAGYRYLGGAPPLPATERRVPFRRRHRPPRCRRLSLHRRPPRRHDRQRRGQCFSGGGRVRLGRPSRHRRCGGDRARGPAVGPTGACRDSTRRHRWPGWPSTADRTGGDRLRQEPTRTL